jgi:metal-responsive CopG/Arc/MetJ family transcriptional regulator
MPARSAQISLPARLLDRLDQRPETRRFGRSAVIQRALALYLEMDRRREVDRAYARGYGGQADRVFDELAALMEGQQWPER